MTSSTPRSRFLKSFAAVLGVLLGAVVISHAVLEQIARRAESRSDYYLWTVDDHLMLFNEGRFVSTQAPERMFIFGASEVGEGIVDEVIQRRLPGMLVEHLSFDGATFHDILLQLKYLEQVYGKSALPSHMLIGLSPRLVANVILGKFGNRLPASVNLYSVSASVNDSGPLPRLVRKGRIRAIMAWLNFRIVQTERYRAAVTALILEMDSRLHAGHPQSTALLETLQKAKMRHRVRASDQALKSVLEQSHWRVTHSWKASEHQDVVNREFAYLEAFTMRNHIKLYFVNLPEWPTNIQMFQPGVYEDYLQAVRKATGGYPFLDLGNLLADSEFVDAVHPTAEGADRESIATADFIRQNEARPSLALAVTREDAR